MEELITVLIKEEKYDALSDDIECNIFENEYVCAEYIEVEDVKKEIDEYNKKGKLENSEAYANNYIKQEIVKFEENLFQPLYAEYIQRENIGKKSQNEKNVPDCKTALGDNDDSGVRKTKPYAKRGTSKKKDKTKPLYHVTRTGQIFLKCSRCIFLTSDKNQLEVHRLQHKTKVRRAPVKNPVRINYRSELCNFSTKNQSNIHRHKISHEKPQNLPSYKCQLCNFSSFDKYALRRHKTQIHELKDVHRKQKMGKYKCDYCNIWLKEKKELNYHLSLHHKDEIATFESQQS